MVKKTKIKKTAKLIFIIIFLSLLPAFSFAAEYHWTGDGPDNNWSTLANWEDAGGNSVTVLPWSSDDVYIGVEGETNDYSVTIENESSIKISSLFIGEGCTLTNDGTLTFPYNDSIGLTNNGTINNNNYVKVYYNYIQSNKGKFQSGAAAEFIIKPGVFPFNFICPKNVDGTISNFGNLSLDASVNSIRFKENTDTEISCEKLSFVGYKTFEAWDSKISCNGNINIEQYAEEFHAKSSTITCKGDLNVIGALYPDSSTIICHGNLNVEGNFWGDEETVIFADASKTSKIETSILRPISFHNFVCTTPGKEIQFQANTSLTIKGNFIIKGGTPNSSNPTGTPVHLTTTDEGADPPYWKLKLDDATVSVETATIEYSELLGNKKVRAYNSNLVDPTIDTNDTIGGDNAEWIFEVKPVWIGSIDSSWNNVDNWNVDFVPTSYDDVIIPTGCNYYPNSISDGIEVKSLTIEEGASLTMEDGHNLTMTTFSSEGSLRLYGNNTINGLPNPVPGIVEYYGPGTTGLVAGDNYTNLVFNGTGTWVLDNTLSTENLTLTNCEVVASTNNIAVAVSGNFTQSGGTFTAGSGTIDVTGNFTQDGGTFNANTGGFSCVDFTSSGTFNAPPENSAITASGDVTISDTFDNPSKNTLIMTGKFNKINTAKQIEKLTISSEASITADGNPIKLLGNLEIEETGSLNFSTVGGDIEGNITCNGTINSGDNNINLAGNLDITTSGNDIRGTGTLTLDGTTQYVTSNGSNIGNLAIVNSSSVTLQDDLTAASLTTVTGTTLIADSKNISVGGTVNIEGGYNADSMQTLTVTGAGDFYSANHIKNLVINAPDKTVSLVNGQLFIDENLTIKNGTLSAGSQTITLKGNWTNENGTFTPETGTVIIAEDDSLTSNISGSSNFHNFECKIAGKTLIFEEGKTQKITTGGSFTIEGGAGAGEEITIKSSITGTAVWLLDVSDIGDTDVSFTNAILTDIDLHQDDDNDDEDFELSLSSSSSCTDNGNNDLFDQYSSPYGQDAARFVFGQKTTTWTGTEGTNWYVSGNWDNGIPTPDDEAIIPEGTTNYPVAEVGISVSTLTLESNSSLTMAENSLTVSTTYTNDNNATLYLQGNETISLPNNFGTDDPIPGTVVYKGSDSYTGLCAGNNYTNLVFDGTGTWVFGTTPTITESLTLTNGTIDASTNNAEVTVSDNFTQSGGTFTAGSGTIGVTGNFTQDGGTFTAGSGTIGVTGNFKQDVGTFIAGTGGLSCVDFTSSGTFNNPVENSVITASGDVSISGEFNNTATNTITAGGDVSISGTFETPSNSSLVINGSGKNLTADNAGTAVPLGNIVVDSSGSISLGSALDAEGNLTVSSGTLIAGDNNINLAGDLDITTSGNYIGGTSTLTLDGTTQDVTSSGRNIGNLSIVNSSSVTLQDVLTATSLTTETGTTLIADSKNISVGGTVNIADTYTADSGQTLTVTGAGDFYSANSIKNLVIDASTNTVTLTGELKLKESLTITNGTLDASTNNIAVTVGGDVDLTNGKYTAGNELFTFNGGKEQNLTSDENNLGSVKTSVSGTNLMLQDPLAVTQITTDAYTTLTVGTNELTSTGAVTNHGTIDSSGGITCTNFTSSDTFNNTDTNTITASGDVLISGTFDNPLNNTLTMTGTSDLEASPKIGGLVIDTNADVTLQNNLTLTKDISIITDGTLDANHKTIKLDGNWTNNGTFTPGEGTVIIAGDEESTTSEIKGSSEFFNFECKTKSKVLKFEAGTTQSITAGGSFTIEYWDNRYKISLQSTTDGSVWYLDLSNDPTVSLKNIFIKDSDLLGSKVVDATINGCTNSGNNDRFDSNVDLFGGDDARWQFSGISSNWTGQVSTDWYEIGNWDNGIPTLYDSAAIQNKPNMPIAEGDISVNGLFLYSNTCLTMKGYSLNVQNIYNSTDTLYLQGDETITLPTGVGTDYPIPGTVVYTGTEDSIADTYTKLAAGTNYENLIFASIDTGTNADTWQLDSDLDVEEKLTLSSGTVNTNNKAVTVGDNFTQSGGTFTAGSGTIGVTGNFAQSDGTFTAGSGTIGVTGNFTQSGGTYEAGTGGLSCVDFTSSVGTFSNPAVNSAITASGNVSISGTFDNPSNNTLTMIGTSKTINTSTSIGNIVVNSSGSISLDSALDAEGNLTVSSGTLIAENNNINLAGNLDLTGGSYTAGTGLFTFNGGTGQTLTSDENNLGSVKTSVSGTNLTLQDPLVVTQITTEEDTTLTVDTNELTSTGAVTNHGTIDSSGGITCVDFISSDTFNNTDTNTITASGDVLISGTFNEPSNNTLTMSGTSNTINTDTQIGNLTILSGAGIAADVNSLKLSGNLEINDTGSLSFSSYGGDIGGDITGSGNLNGGSAILKVGGNFNITNFICKTGTVEFTTGVGESQILGSNTFYNLKCTTASKVLKFQAGETQSIASSGRFTINGNATGTEVGLQSTTDGSVWYLDLSNSPNVSVEYASIKDSDLKGELVIDVPDNCTNGGNNDLFDSNVTLFGEDNARWQFPSIDCTWTGGDDENWYNDNNWDNGIPKPADNAIIPEVTTNYPVADDNISVSTLTLASTSSSLTMAGNSLTVSTTYTNDNNATLYLQGDETISLPNDFGTDKPMPGTVEYYGTGDFSLCAGNNYKNLVFNGEGKWTLDESLNIATDLTLTNGTVDTNNKAVTVGGDFAQDGGTFTAGTGGLNCVDFTSSGTFNNPTENTITASGDVLISGTFDNPSNNTLTMTGTSKLEASLEIGGLVIDANAVVILQNNLTLAKDISIITDGTLDANNKIIILNGNWTNNGTFTPRLGKVIIAGEDEPPSEIKGSSEFYNFECKIAGKTLIFEEGKTQKITPGGSFTIEGKENEEMITIKSSDTENAVWYLDVSELTDANKVSFTYAKLTDIDLFQDISHKTVLFELAPYTCENLGNNDIYDDSSTLFGEDAARFSFEPKDRTWTGAKGTNWYDIGNWEDGIPTPNDNAIIPKVTTMPVAEEDIKIGTLKLEDDTSLSMAGYKLTVSTTYTSSGTLFLQGDETISLPTGVGTDTPIPGTVEYTGEAATTDTYTNLAAGYKYTNLKITSQNDNWQITDNDVTVTGETIIDVDAGNNLKLNNTNNDFNSIEIKSGYNITIKDLNEIQLNRVTITNNFDLTGSTIKVTDKISTNGVIDFKGKVIVESGDNPVLGANGGINLTGEVILSGNGLREFVSSGGDITFTSTINGDGDNDEILSLSAGGVIDIKGQVGGTNPPKHVLIKSCASLNNSTPAAINLAETDLFIDAAGPTIGVSQNLNVGNFYFYNGTLNLGTKTLTTTGDFAVFGANFDPDDPDRDAGNELFNYPEVSSLGYFPNDGSYTAPVRGFSNSTTGAAFTDLAGATINVGKNFYVNGVDMTATGDWTLNISDNSAADNLGYKPNGGWPFGNKYATAFNMSVSHSQASGGYVAANTVVNSNNNTNWDFSIPVISSARTISDNVIEVTFSEAIENSNNEISNALTVADGNTVSDCGIWLADGTIHFDGAYADAECNTPLSDNNFDTDVIYLKVSNESWNTDATGASAGDVNSTNLSGVARNSTGMADPIVPDLSFIKGLLVDAEGHNLVRGYIDDTKYTDTTDACSPALVNVVAGRAAHKDEATDFIYDAHNYFHLRYSEPVTIGDLTNASANVPAKNSFSDNTEHGGAILSDDDNNYVEVAGFFKYGDDDNICKLPLGSKDSDIAYTSTIYRANANGENPSGDHGLSLYVAAHRADEDSPWPGYIGDPSLNIDEYIFKYNITPDGNADESYLNPVGAPVEVIANNYITDATGNVVQPPKENIVIEALGETSEISMPVDDAPGWDVDPPFFSKYVNNENSLSDLTYYEIVTRDSSESGLVDVIDIFMRDNIVAQAGWVSDGSNDNHIDTNPLHGLRDSSWQENVTWGLSPKTSIKLQSAEISESTSDYNIGFSTNTQNNLFSDDTGKTYPKKEDDPYFSLNIKDYDHGWNYETSLRLTYNASAGMITDLAGNLVPSTAPDIVCFIKTYPQIELSLASVGDERIYIKFTEPLVNKFGNDLTAEDFDFSPPGISITSIEPITIKDGGLLEAWFKLSDKISANVAYSGLIRSLNDKVFSLLEVPMSSELSHRTSDVALGIMVPVWALGQSSKKADFEEPEESLRIFDGTGTLMNGNVLIETSILAEDCLTLPTALYFDVDPSETVLQNGLWLPEENPLLVPQANVGAVKLDPIRAKNAIRDFFIDSDNDKIKKDVDIQFLLQLGDLYCMRLTDQNDPRSLVPWQFGLEGNINQSAGVTILSNVINPEKGEKTIINFDIKTPGVVIINVFNLAGDLVRTLEKGELIEGIYSYTWGGKNRAGNNVGRGIYFIRVVAPGIDEYRKVLVVK